MDEPSNKKRRKITDPERLRKLREQLAANRHKAAAARSQAAKFRKEAREAEKWRSRKEQESHIAEYRKWKEQLKKEAEQEAAVEAKAEAKANNAKASEPKEEATKATPKAGTATDNRTAADAFVNPPPMAPPITLVRHQSTAHVYSTFHNCGGSLPY